MTDRKCISITEYQRTCGQLILKRQEKEGAGFIYPVREAVPSERRCVGMSERMRETGSLTTEYSLHRRKGQEQRRNIFYPSTNGFLMKKFLSPVKEP